jgi:hypothetical protein
MIAILTTSQKDSLVGQEFTPNNLFNPIQDVNNNWVISQQEIDGCTNTDFAWVKNLTLSTYYPKLVNI